MKRSPSSHPRAGFTLVDLIIGTSLASVVFGALTFGALALQRTYATVDAFGAARGDQLRALDYITRDVRRSQSVTVTASPPTIALTIPGYIDPATGLPRDPAISSGAITYGGTTSITYSKNGSALVRSDSATLRSKPE